MLTAAVIGWTAAMVLHSLAYAADEPIDEAKDQWQIMARVDSNDGEQTRVLGWAGDFEKKEAFKFDTEAECKEFLRTSPKLKTMRIAVNKIAAKWNPPGHLELKCQTKPDKI